MENLVSICIPVFNGEAFLSESLQSVIHQDYPSLEIIIVDDGSSDGSLAIAADYAKKDNRIRIEKNPGTLGLVQNWNKCIRLSSGQWFKLHFQDDLMEPYCISEMLNFALQHDASLVLSDRTYLYEKGIDKGHRHLFETRLKKLDVYIDHTRLVSVEEIADIFTGDFLGYNFLGEPIVGLLNKKCITRYGEYDTNFLQVSDFEFWLRVSLNEGLGYIKKPLTKFRVHDSSQTSRNSKKNRSKKSVSTQMTDRIHLGLKIAKNDTYLTYRQHVKKVHATTIEQLLSRKFTKYIAATGYFTSKRLFGPEILAYFKHNPLTLLKAFYHDVARL